MAKFPTGLDGPVWRLTGNEADYPPEVTQAVERFRAARDSLEATEEEVVASPDAPKPEKLKALANQRPVAEHWVKTWEEELVENQEDVDKDIQWYQNAVATATDDKEREFATETLTRKIAEKAATLASDQKTVDAARQKLAGIDAQIAANSA